MKKAFLKKRVLVIAGLLIMISMISGCIPGDGSYDAGNLAGFFTGVWHGWIAPISLVLSFFDNDIRIYEVMNTGIMYDLGFYIAIISGFGGISLSRKRKEK